LIEVLVVVAVTTGLVVAVAMTVVPVLPVDVLRLVTVRVFVTGDAASEQALVTIIPGYWLRTDGSEMSRFWTLMLAGTVGSAGACTPLMVVQDVASASRLLGELPKTMSVKDDVVVVVEIVVVVVGERTSTVVIVEISVAIVVVGRTRVVVEESSSMVEVVVGETSVVVVRMEVVEMEVAMTVVVTTGVV
jgi:hypothetical protein